MKRFIVILVLLAITFSTAFAQEETATCPSGEWYTVLVAIKDDVENNLPLPEDTLETLSDKTITLYAHSFLLEAVATVTPPCGQTLVRKYSILVGAYADLGMLLVLQIGDLGLSEAVFETLLEQRLSFIRVGESSVNLTRQQLNLVEGTMQ